MPRMLDPSQLMNLSTQALYGFCKYSPAARGRISPSGLMMFTGEPYADLNLVFMEAPHPQAAADLEVFLADAGAMKIGEGPDKGKPLPYIVILAHDAEEELGPVCAARGLQQVDAMPFMTCDALGFEVVHNLEFNVNRVAAERDWQDWCLPFATGFGIRTEHVMRTFPLRMVDVPGMDLYLARHRDGSPVGCVTTTRHGDVVGIWAMAVHPDHQRQGIGRVLLTRVMDEFHRRFDVSTFFLGATPAGLPLYRKIGFKTVTETAVWTAGGGE